MRLLVGGLRRRAGRSIPGSVRRDDDAFLTAVADRFPETRSAVDTVRRALRQPAPPRELIAVADAVRTIEQHLTTTFSQHS